MFYWWAKKQVRNACPTQILGANDYGQANDPAFLTAAMQYTRDIVMTGEILLGLDFRNCTASDDQLGYLREVQVK